MNAVAFPTSRQHGGNTAQETMPWWEIAMEVCYFVRGLQQTAVSFFFPFSLFRTNENVSLALFYWTRQIISHHEKRLQYERVCIYSVFYCFVDFFFFLSLGKSFPSNNTLQFTKENHSANSSNKPKDVTLIAVILIICWLVEGSRATGD